MSTRLFLYGVPGTGKTYFSKQLGKQLNLQVIEGDMLKNEARKGKAKQTDPFLFLGTCQAWREFGELNHENAIKGLLAVRAALSETVQKKIESHQELVLEAAFLDPNGLQAQGKVILLTATDEQQHRKQFLHHREKLLDLGGKEFSAARMIQEYLITEAKRLQIEVIDNNDSPDKILSKMNI